MKVHFIGIGGIGMSALARYFLSENWQVSGSDLSPSSITDELKKEGMAVYIGKHSANNFKNPQLVIYNQAITSDNPELKKARTLGLSCKSYPEAIGELTKKYKTIAIAGAHGKSTTTALISLILIAAGFDPTVIIGTKLKEFAPSARLGSNFRKGKSNWLVLEADEWKASFLHYFPTLGVITNIDKEHLDFYKNLTNVKKSFLRFIKNIKPGGALFLNRDCSNCHSLIRANKRMTPNRKILVSILGEDKIVKKIKKILRVPGLHNVSNALMAYSVAKYLKIPEKIIWRALDKYRGAWRRMEYRGTLKIENWKLKIFDDYAHHPTEIKATLAAFREKWPKNALICVFQPHQVERLKLLFSAFKSAFKAADKVILLPTYEVAGRERQIYKKYTSEALAKVIGAVYVKNPKRDLKKVLIDLIIRNSRHSHTFADLHHIVVMMGAGDIVNYTPSLIK